MSKSLLNELSQYPWVGNIRQLQNFVKNFVLFGSEVPEEDYEIWLNEPGEFQRDELTFTFVKGTFDEIEEVKKWLVHKIFKKNGNNISKTARFLGMTYAGLYRLLKKNGLLPKNSA